MLSYAKVGAVGAGGRKRAVGIERGNMSCGERGSWACALDKQFCEHIFGQFGLSDSAASRAFPARSLDPSHPPDDEESSKVLQLYVDRTQVMIL